MDANRTGVEIHALRGLVEEAVAERDKEITAAGEQNASPAVKEKRDVLRRIMDKLPVEFDTVAWRTRPTKRSGTLFADLHSTRGRVMSVSGRARARRARSCPATGGSNAVPG